MLIIWCVAGASSLLAYRYLPENSHVVVGALAGGVLGAVWMEKKNEHRYRRLRHLHHCSDYGCGHVDYAFGGVFVMSFVPINYRVQQFISAMSGSVLVALLAPWPSTAITAHGWPC